MGNEARRLRALIVASAVFALGASPGAPAGQGFTLHNHTERTLDALYVSPTGAGQWSDDILGQDILDDHTDLVVKFPHDENDCNWDVRGVFKDGASEQVNDVDFCSVSDVTFTR